MDGNELAGGGRASLWVIGGGGAACDGWLNGWGMWLG